MADLITLTGVTGTGHHGVFDQEKRDGQTFAVDLTLETDHSAAGASDSLEDTVNYADLATAIHHRITGEPFELIEALAESIAADALRIAGPRGLAVTVTVHKPQAPIEVPFGSVSVTVRRERTSFVLAFGSNLGDSGQTLADAVRQLGADPRVIVEGVSDVARTKAVGGPEGQPDYLNLVVVGETTLQPRGLLALAQRIERDHHRTREVRWGPRTLDIDLIDVGGRTALDPLLTLPHPRAHERAFVLAPWSWLDPLATLSGRGGGRRVGDLAAVAADFRDVERLGPLASLGLGAEGAETLR
jgi:dihydroneopterin aldolase/2-amino-4-hydroxy-6-hydroxymethyldihydropteridine diphosphokinase